MNYKPQKRRWLYSMAAWVLTSIVLLSMLVTTSLAATVSDYTGGTESEVVTRAVTGDVTLTKGGQQLSVAAKQIDGRLFVPLGDFARLFTSATYQYSATTQYATLTAPGLTLTAGLGGTFLTANDRPLYGVSVNRMINGTMWVPLSPLAKALGLTVSHSAGSTTATLSGNYRAITPAAQFYREDEVYWLSRIISAESRGEPLRGQMAVGNVILNRTRSPYFPNTIWGVIFERGQFSPVSNGSIYNAPAWTSVIAAKMCLEGYSISNDVLFFCNLNSASSHWIENNRTFAFRIGAHSFFF